MDSISQEINLNVMVLNALFEKNIFPPIFPSIHFVMVMVSYLITVCWLRKVQYFQGGHGTGKTGNLVLTFSRQGKHREFCSDTGKNLLTQGKYLDCNY